MQPYLGPSALKLCEIGELLGYKIAVGSEKTNVIQRSVGFTKSRPAMAQRPSGPEVQRPGGSVAQS